MIVLAIIVYYLEKDVLFEPTAGRLPPATFEESGGEFVGPTIFNCEKLCEDELEKCLDKADNDRISCDNSEFNIFYDSVTLCLDNYAGVYCPREEGEDNETRWLRCFPQCEEILRCINCAEELNGILKESLIECLNKRIEQCNAKFQKCREDCGEGVPR